MLLLEYFSFSEIYDIFEAKTTYSLPKLNLAKVLRLFEGPVVNMQTMGPVASIRCFLNQGVSNTQKKDTILFLALNLPGKSIFTSPKFFLSAVTQLPYKEIWGEGGVQNLRNFFRKVFRTMRYVQKSCQKWGSKNFSVFSNLALTFHLRMPSVNGLQNSISQPILHPKRGSCLLLASWIPLVLNPKLCIFPISSS